jgi:hypothetical protein
MHKTREYQNVDGRHPQDIFSHISDLNQQFPDRNYKLAFDLQPLKEGGYRGTVKFWGDLEPVIGNSNTVVTHKDDFESVLRSGGQIRYFASDDERLRFDAEIDADVLAIEELLTEDVKGQRTRRDNYIAGFVSGDLTRDDVLFNIKENGLNSAAEAYGFNNIGDLLVECQIGLFDLKGLFGFSTTRYQINPTLATAIGVTVEFLVGLREEGKLVPKYDIPDTE